MRPDGARRVPSANCPRTWRRRRSWSQNLRPVAAPDLAGNAPTTTVGTHRDSSGRSHRRAKCRRTDTRPYVRTDNRQNARTDSRQNPRTDNRQNLRTDTRYAIAPTCDRTLAPTREVSSHRQPSAPSHRHAIRHRTGKRSTLAPTGEVSSHRHAIVFRTDNRQNLAPTTVRTLAPTRVSFVAPTPRCGILVPTAAWCCRSGYPAGRPGSECAMRPSIDSHVQLFLVRR